MFNVRNCALNFEKVQNMVRAKLFITNSCTFDVFLEFELRALVAYRTSLDFLKKFARIDENIFQKIYQNYLTGLISNFATTDLLVVAANSVLLSCSILTTGESGEEVKRELRGHTDIMVCRQQQDMEILTDEIEENHLDGATKDSKSSFPDNVEIIIEVKVLEGMLHHSEAWKPKDQLLGQLECCGKPSLFMQFNYIISCIAQSILFVMMASAKMKDCLFKGCLTDMIAISICFMLPVPNDDGKHMFCITPREVEPERYILLLLLLFCDISPEEFCNLIDKVADADDEGEIREDPEREKFTSLKKSDDSKLRSELGTSSRQTPTPGSISVGGSALRENIGNGVSKISHDLSNNGSVIKDGTVNKTILDCYLLILLPYFYYAVLI